MQCHVSTMLAYIPFLTHYRSLKLKMAIFSQPHVWCCFGLSTVQCEPRPIPSLCSKTVMVFPLWTILWTRLLFYTTEGCKLTENKGRYKDSRPFLRKQYGKPLKCIVCLHFWLCWFFKHQSSKIKHAYIYKILQTFDEHCIFYCTFYHFSKRLLLSLWRPATWGATLQAGLGPSSLPSPPPNATLIINNQQSYSGMNPGLWAPSVGYTNKFSAISATIVGQHALHTRSSSWTTSLPKRQGNAGTAASCNLACRKSLIFNPQPRFLILASFSIKAYWSWA